MVSQYICVGKPKSSQTSVSVILTTYPRQNSRFTKTPPASGATVNFDSFFSFLLFVSHLLVSGLLPGEPALCWGRLLQIVKHFVPYVRAREQRINLSSEESNIILKHVFCLAHNQVDRVAAVTALKACLPLRVVCLESTSPLALACCIRACIHLRLMHRMIRR